jgi:hypothetical protein
MGIAASAPGIVSRAWRRTALTSATAEPAALACSLSNSVLVIAVSKSHSMLTVTLIREF